MDAVDLFKARAQAALDDLNQLAQEGLQEKGRRDELSALGERLEKMRSDGQIDPGERAELMRLLEASGIDVTSLASSKSGELGAKAQERIDEAIDAATETNTLRSFRIQLAMNELGTNVRVASETSRAEHQAYMAVVGNMKA